MDGIRWLSHSLFRLSSHCTFRIADFYDRHAAFIYRAVTAVEFGGGAEQCNGTMELFQLRWKLFLLQCG